MNSPYWQIYTPPFNRERRAEIAESRLARDLHFTESDEMAVIVEAITCIEDLGQKEFVELIAYYEDLAQSRIDELESYDQNKARLGMILRVAEIRKQSGRIVGYYFDLEQAQEIAINCDLEDIKLIISAKIDCLLYLEMLSAEAVAVRCALALKDARPAHIEGCEQLARLSVDEALNIADHIIAEASA